MIWVNAPPPGATYPGPMPTYRPELLATTAVALDRLAHAVLSRAV